MMAREKRSWLALVSSVQKKEVISKRDGDGRRRTGSENLRIRRAGNPAAP
jgi:hypothetical protein